MDETNALEKTIRELGELKELRERVAAQEQVQRDYLNQIENLRGQLREAREEAERAADAKWTPERETLTDELGLYRTLIQGWPEGRRLVERLTRDLDNDYDYDYNDD